MHIFTAAPSFPRVSEKGRAERRREGERERERVPERTPATSLLIRFRLGQGPLDPVSGRSRGTPLGIVTRDQADRDLSLVEAFEVCACTFMPGMLASRTNADLDASA